MTTSDVISVLNEAANPDKVAGVSSFFKTAPGQYGEGDVFLGISVPALRKIARQFKDLPLTETELLLHSPLHECRQTALFILVQQYKNGSLEEQDKIYNLYLANTAYINNWDLVDSSAEYIVGPYLENRDKGVLITLAHSQNLWERRIAMLACFHYIWNGDPEPAFPIIAILEHDSHDLIQKAVGWMLREIGKRCSSETLVRWLKEGDRYKKLPRTTLRYAIEHFSKEERQAYLKGLV